MAECSDGPHGTFDRGVGMIGVIGPQRMAYCRAGALMRAAAGALDGLLSGPAA